MPTLTPEQQRLVRRAEGAPITLEDPDTHVRYVLVPEDVYVRLQRVLELGELSIDEQPGALAQLGAHVGWDDAAMDVYNDL